MNPVFGIALYLLAWALLAAWTVVKSSHVGRHFDPRSPGYAFIPPRRAAASDRH